MALSTLLGLTACGGGDDTASLSPPDGNTPVETAGVPVAPFVLATTGNVQATVVTSPAMSFSLQGATANTAFDYQVNRDFILNVGKTASAMQDGWITAEVAAAWAQGWTGNGVKIGVLDDFTPQDDSEFLRIQHPTGCTVAVLSISSIKLCSDKATAAYRLTHGDQVAGIAGATTSTFTGKLTESGSYTEAAHSGTYQSTADIIATFSTPYYGVAKDAEVIRGDFLSHQQSTNGLFAVLKDWGVGADARSHLYQEVKVVNLSLSSGSRDPVLNQSLFDSQLAYASTSTTPDAVYVKAGGNFACVASEPGCDPINQVLYSAAAFKDKTILVGALDKPAGRLADYSNKAGRYADRFVVADGRGIHNTEGGYVDGTSFAAPRVAGYAAIIRHKYPNLSAANTARAILDSAVWNPAWGDKTPATQALYGQGEASLSRALVQAGTLR